MKNYYHRPEENRFYIVDDGTYISKIGEFYSAFRADGTEIEDVVIPINISIMCLKGMLPAGIKIRPSQEETEIEPSLKALLDN